MPQGQRLVARDGDTLVIPTGARVRVIRRTEGTLRIVHNAAARWVAILYDVARPAGASSEGKVDGSFRFDDVEGAWPLGERWQGSGVIEEYLMPQGLLRVGIGITTDAGLVQLFSGSPSPGAANGQWFQDSRAASVLYYHSGGGGGMSSRMSFDQAEQFIVQQAAREAQMREARKGTAAPLGGFSTSVTMGAEPGPGGVTLTPAGNGIAPVRVGGSITTPQKVVDAKPAYPPIAQAARVQGVVILEITIAPDGSVTDAKVLRSIPLLDQAALDCVKQWKYEPTQINGTPVPVIMTVTVNFAMQE
jgi:TonB family protein